MKRAFKALVLLVVFGFLPMHVAAQAAVSYPVVFSGGFECVSKADCARFCDDPTNRDRCTKWAQEQGIETEAESISSRFDDPLFLAAAQESLACSSQESCKAICSIPENIDRCDEFALQYDLPGGIQDSVRELEKFIQNGFAEDQQSLALSEEAQRLRDALARVGGEDATRSPEEFCEDESNADVCSQIAVDFGLHGGLVSNGPGGCQTDDTCRDYCDNPENITECQAYGLSGPGECTNPFDCWAYCQNPTNLCSDTTVSAVADVRLEHTTEACRIDTTAEGTRQALASIERIATCDVVDATDDESGACESYLASNEAVEFDNDEFSESCRVVSVPRPDIEMRVEGDGSIDRADITTALVKCADLRRVNGNAERRCVEVIQAYNALRIQCSKPEQERPSEIASDVGYARLCLSSPRNLRHYQDVCTEDEGCSAGGYDWYCSEYPDRCTPLVDGEKFEDIAVGGFVTNWTTSWKSAWGEVSWSNAEWQNAQWNAASWDDASWTQSAWSEGSWSEGPHISPPQRADAAGKSSFGSVSGSDTGAKITGVKIGGWEGSFDLDQKPSREQVEKYVKDGYGWNGLNWEEEVFRDVQWNSITGLNNYKNKGRIEKFDGLNGVYGENGTIDRTPQPTGTTGSSSTGSAGGDDSRSSSTVGASRSSASSGSTGSSSSITTSSSTSGATGTTGASSAGSTGSSSSSSGSTGISGSSSSGSTGSSATQTVTATDVPSPTSDPDSTGSTGSSGPEVTREPTSGATGSSGSSADDVTPTPTNSSQVQGVSTIRNFWGWFLGLFLR